MSGSEASISWKRAGWPNSCVTSLNIPNGKAAIDFWVKAFGMEIIDQTLGPDGCLFHAVLRLGDTILMASEPQPEMGIGVTSVGLYVYVPDADAAFKRAVDAGAKELNPVQEWFWGDRSGSLKDAWGIRWTIATRVKEVSSEDVKRAGDKWIEDHPDSFNKHSTTADHTAKTE